MGRKTLLGLVDRATTADPPPLIIVEGCGGSGRTALLCQVHETWHDRTPTVLVDSLSVKDDGTIRPVLAAIVLGLNTLTFPRVTLALDVMSDDRADAPTEVASAWFAQQGRGFDLDGPRLLARLSEQAHSTVPRVRRAVDDLLVAALLADIADGEADALVLLDDGDTPAAAAFASALLRVSQASVEGTLPDSLTVVATSSGPLAEALTAYLPPAMRWDESRLTSSTRAFGPWLRISSAGLTRDEVDLLARARELPEVVGQQVFRLTGGHPASTELVLSRFVDSVDAVLRGPVEEQLLRQFVRALTPDKEVDDTLLTALITVSAARDRREAAALVDCESPVITSPTLWPGERMHSLAKYLGLRALADRPEQWARAFETLADTADLAGRLHHQRMLGHRAEVAAELADLVPTMPSRDWLDLFDEVVATADPRDTPLVDQPDTLVSHVFRLIGVVPAYEHNPCVIDRDALRSYARCDFLRLAQEAPDPRPYRRRAAR